MPQQNDWDLGRTDRISLFGTAGMGALRIALLFGSAAVALALFLAPVAENYSRSQFARGGAEGLDLSSTGTVPARKAYTVRRSVLQASPTSICVIGANGAKSGDC